MTNNTPTDIARLIATLESQVAMREPDVDRRRRFLADTENHQYIEDMATFELQLAEAKAKLEGIQFALGEAKAIAEGY